MSPVSMRTWTRRACAAWCVVAVTSLPARAEAPLVAVGSSQSVHVAPDLWPSIQTMLENSETFRQQYQRILETPRLVLTAHVEVGMAGYQVRARSSIRRYDSGLMVVTIEIGPRSDHFELIAHEFEHVLEQLEGVDLRARADRGRAAWYSHGAMIETERAVRAGRTVKAEVRHVTR